MVVLAPTATCEPPPPEAWELPPAVPIERPLGTGGLHLYRAELAAGKNWRIVVEQRGIDVTVTAITPGGERLAPVDSPLDREGSESLILYSAPTSGTHSKTHSGTHSDTHSGTHSDTPGTYGIEIHAHEAWAPDGRYEIRLEAVEDPRFIAAEAARTKAARHYGKNERREALTAWRESLRQWRALDLPREATREMYCVAVLERLVSESTNALHSAEEALRRWQELGERYWEAATLNEIGLNHRDLDMPSQARKFFNRALELWRTVDNPYGVVTTRNNICLTHLTKGALRQGLTCYQPIFDDLGRLREPQLEAVVFLNVAWAYNRLGEPDAALEHYDRALMLMRQTHNRKGEAQTLNNLGELYETLGQPEQALASYELALERFRALDDLRWQGTVLNNIGHQYISLAEPQRAHAFLRESLDLRRAVGNRSGEMVTLNNLGQAYRQLGNQAEALSLFGMARQLAEELERPLMVAKALTNLAATRIEMGAPEKALGNAEVALDLFRTRGARSNEAEALFLIGRCQFLLGRPEKALAALDQALTLHRTVRNRSAQISTLTAMAQAERSLGDPNEAKIHLESALELIETLRVRIPNSELRATAQGSRRSTYDSYIDLLMEMHRNDPSAGYHLVALESSERARARSLLDLLNEDPGSLQQGVDPELLKQRTALMQRLNAKALRQEALMSAKPNPEQQVAELDLASVLHDLDRVEARIRTGSPHFAALTQPQPLDASEIRRLLDSETILLEYTLGEENSFLWLVTTENIHGFQLPPRAHIEALARRVHRGLSNPDTRNRRVETQEAAALSQILLGPVASRLDRQRLVIVADGALHYLPFAALPQPAVASTTQKDTTQKDTTQKDTTQKDTTPEGPVVPLLENHEIVHLPSASVLAVLRRELTLRKPADRWLVAVADPVFDLQDPRLLETAQTTTETPRPPETALKRSVVERSAERGVPLPLKRLPASRREAIAITALAPPGQARLLLGFAANRAAMFDEEMRQFQIVHFATHGVINAQTPRLSGLALSLFDEHQQAQEGFLRLHEIYNLRLQADLVVLSGCQTALGKEIRGEGLVGLTRGFMHANVPRVVASLWRVEDRATAELMTRFYHGISIDNLPPAAALRAAQRSIRRERRWKDPYYWSAFVLLGEWQPRS